jgi:hypothetical protein
MNKYAEIESGWIPGHENAFRPNAVGKIQLYDKAAKAVKNVVEDVAEAVGDVVEDVVETVETVAKVVAENPEILFIAIAAPYAISAVGTALGASAATITAVTAPITAATITASQGGDLEDIGKAALAAYIAPQIAGQASSAASTAGLQNTLANAVGGAAGGATAAAITGGDIAESALGSAIASGVGAEAKEFGVEQGLKPVTAETVGRVVGAAAGGAATGDTDAAVTGALLGELNRELKKLTTDEVDIGFGPGKFQKDLTEQDIAGMPEEQFDRMMSAIEQDLSTTEREQLFAADAPGIGKQDFSLTAGTTRRPRQDMGGAQGAGGELQELPEDINFEEIFAGEYGGEGLRVPEVSAAEGMGGGSGLTVPRDRETVTARGVEPEDQILRQIEQEMTPSSGSQQVVRQPSDLSTVQLRIAREAPESTAVRETPAISTRVTGEAGEGILGEKEPLFGGDEDDQRAVWNRRSLRLRRALGF